MPNDTTDRKIIIPAREVAPTILGALTMIRRIAHENGAEDIEDILIDAQADIRELHEARFGDNTNGETQ